MVDALPGPPLEMQKKGSPPREREQARHGLATVEEEGSVWQCRHCGKVFNVNTSTSSLVKHLKQEHMDVPEVHFAFAPGHDIKGNNINVFDAEKADNLLGQLITNKYLPLWLVKDEDFINLIAYLHPPYKPQGANCRCTDYPA